MSVSAFDLDLPPQMKPLPARAPAPAEPDEDNEPAPLVARCPQTSSTNCVSTGRSPATHWNGWSWSPQWQRYIHCDTKTMWDPARQMYSTWDDAGNVTDYPAQSLDAAEEMSGKLESAAPAFEDEDVKGPDGTFAARGAGGLRGKVDEDDAEEYTEAIYCHSTDDSCEAEEAAEERFAAYYSRASGPHEIAVDVCAQAIGGSHRNVTAM